MITEADIKAAATNIAVKDALKSGRVVTIEEYESAKRREFIIGIIIGLSLAVLAAGIAGAFALH